MKIAVLNIASKSSAKKAKGTRHPQDIPQKNIMTSNMPKPKLLMIGLSAAITAASMLTCLAGTTGDVKKGEAVFKKMQCAICHPGGNNILNPQKPLKGAAFLKKYTSDKLLMQTVRSGIPTRGMPAFGTEKLNDSDLFHLITYVRTFTAAESKTVPDKSLTSTPAAKHAR